VKTLPFLALPTLAALGACAGTSPPPTRIAAPPPAIAAPSLQVIGATAQALIARLGQPALDQREGPARKLQFRGEACILDAYLYPQPNNAPAHVTWIDARDRQGKDVDKAGCIAALTTR
jgi:hypothetical protein